MNSMSDIIRKAQTGEPTTNGGQFGSAPARPEADLELDDGVVTVDFTGTFEIDNGVQDELPEYPDSLPEPHVSLDWDGGPRSIISVGGTPFTFWVNAEGESFNSINDGRTTREQWEALGDEDTREQFIEWGAAVHKRVDDAIYTATLAVVSNDVEDAILAMAQGKRPGVA
jgi:hypothetical protein